MTGPEREVGALVASGRSADVYDYGPGRVLRRRRKSPVGAAEPTVMRAVGAAGYPVPGVHRVDGHDMVLDRIDGVDLLTVLGKKPWLAWRTGRTLADLHERLVEVRVDRTDAAVSELPIRVEPGEVFFHGDLHPGNVIDSPDGPIVIDWESAGLGARDADVATTWLLMEIAEPDDVPACIRPLVGLIKWVMKQAFLRGVGRPRPQTVAAVCERRLADPNMRPVELQRIRAFAAAHAGGLLSEP